MYSKAVFLFTLLTVDAAPNVYDQSQNGELNIQVDLKDLQIFALSKGQHEEYYEDIDYAYDYSEMTIKPQNTSKKPLNVTTTDISTDGVGVTETTTKSEINTSQNMLNVTSTGSSIENESDMTIKPALNTLNVTNISTTDNVIRMTVKPSIEISQNPLNVTTVGTSLDNVTDNAIKPQVSTLINIMNVTTSRISTEYITQAPTVSTKNNTEEHDGLFSFFSRLFEPFSSTISNTSSLLKLQSREDNGVATTSQNNMKATKNTNESDVVTRKPQSEISTNILPVKSEIEYTSTRKLVDTTETNVSTKLTTNSNCKKGYLPNQRGRCVLKMPALSNALMKIVKLAQKLKPRRHRNGHDTR